jgi:hypothetical protein
MHNPAHRTARTKRSNQFGWRMLVCNFKVHGSYGSGDVASVRNFDPPFLGGRPRMGATRMDLLFRTCEYLNTANRVLACGDGASGWLL